MNRDEAKYILSAWRLDGQDAADPQFREALELLKKDQELSEWFAQEQTLDSKVAARLASVRVPIALKGRLMAARKVIRPTPWWRKPAWLAAAASIVALLYAGRLWFAGKADDTLLEPFRHAMVDEYRNLAHHVEAKNLDYPELNAWLSAHGGRSNFALPASLVKSPPSGCNVLSWNGHKVSLLCYWMKGGQHVDVFVIRNSDLPKVLRSEPQFKDEDGYATAMWQRGHEVFLVVAEVPRQELEQLLALARR